MKKNKSIAKKESKKQKADKLRRKAIRSGIRSDKFVEKWVEDGKHDPKIRNSQLMEWESKQLERKADRDYDEYYKYVHSNFSKKSINDSMEACIKNDKKRKNKGFLSRMFINRLK